MAHSLSAKKRVRQNVKHRAVNRWRKGRVREAISAYREAVLHAPVEEAQEKLQGLYKLLDQVAAKGTLHKNAAARYKSRLTAKLNAKKTAAAA
jgi:small subunit ribosomal protein S20